MSTPAVITQKKQNNHYKFAPLRFSQRLWDCIFDQTVVNRTIPSKSKPGLLEKLLTWIQV